MKLANPTIVIENSIQKINGINTVITSNMLKAFENAILFEGSYADAQANPANCSNFSNRDEQEFEKLLNSGYRRLTEDELLFCNWASAMYKMNGVSYRILTKN